jgi:hypothetical protein
MSLPNLPRLDHPERYAGLYVFDFGDSVAVGYTANEIEMLFESEKHRHGKAYKIHRAFPDGQMELRGVSPRRFETEDGLFFYRREGDAARKDFAELKRISEIEDPPCRAKLHLGRIEGNNPEHVTALIYPAEYADEMSAWLMRHGYQGGDFVEGGVSGVTTYYESKVVCEERHQMWGTIDHTSRSQEEVYASVGKAIQR